MVGWRKVLSHLLMLMVIVSDGVMVWFYRMMVALGSRITEGDWASYQPVGVLWTKMQVLGSYGPCQNILLN